MSTIATAQPKPTVARRTSYGRYVLAKVLGALGSLHLRRWS